MDVFVTERRIIQGAKRAGVTYDDLTGDLRECCTKVLHGFQRHDGLLGRHNSKGLKLPKIQHLMSDADYQDLDA